MAASANKSMLLAISVFSMLPIHFNYDDKNLSRFVRIATALGGITDMQTPSLISRCLETITSLVDHHYLQS